MSGFATACVLSYERPDFLRDSLTTMIEGADYPLEIIVHDDGSRDPRVGELLRELLGQGKVSTVIANPPGHNQGQGVALNRMFTVAQGDPIIKADQDLMYHPGWLRRSVEILEGNQARVREFGPGHEEPNIGALGLFRYPVEPVKYEDMLMPPGRAGQTTGAGSSTRTSWGRRWSSLARSGSPSAPSTSTPPPSPRTANSR